MTLKLLAQKLHMSVSSISKALSNHPAMKQETRSKVQKMAEQMHYTPNNWAINFRKGRTGIIGVIIPDLLDHFFVKFFCGLEQYALQNGYQLLISQTFDSTENEISASQRFLDMKVDGMFVAISRTTTSFDHWTAFEEKNIPVVYYGRDPLYLPECHKVLVNNFEASFLATQFLIDSGHTNIAFLGGPEADSCVGDRLNGYLTAMKKNNLFLSGDLNAYTDFEEGNFDDIIEKIFLKPNDLPDAMLVCNEPVLFRTLSKLTFINPDLARKIKCVVFGTAAFSEYLPCPSILSIEENAELLGSQAMVLIMKLITGHIDIKNYQKILIDCELVSL